MILILFSVLLFPGSTDASGYSWKPGQNLRSWNFQNVKDVRFTENGVMIYKKFGSPDFMFSPPTGTISSKSRVRMKLRTLMPGGVINCILFVGNRIIPSPYISILSGSRWKDYICDLSSAGLEGTSIDGIVVLIGNIDSIEMSYLKIQKPSFSDFFVTDGLRAYNINSRHPYKLYGYTLNLWFYGVIAVVSLCAIALYAFTKKRKFVYTIGIIYLALYLLYDARENFHDVSIAHTTYNDFTSALPGEKRFFYWEELIEFALFVRQNLPDGAETLNFYGDHKRFLYIRYLLYPLKVLHNNQAFSKINVFHDADKMSFSGNRVISDGKVAMDNGRVIAYNRRSFIYIKQ
jgi:hypothetical protein